MKKIIAILTVIMIFILPLSVTYNQQKAHASVISKPLTITAKKVAKDLAKNSAVEMAEHILFEKMINEFINSDLVDEGYSAVCLDGPKNKVEDCAPEKRAQIKKDLTSTDKTKLTQKVEQVLEKKTNTSSKWAKFLDWFIPIFLISGLVAAFDSFMDPDSESLIDDIAQEALVESGLLKPLGYFSTGGSDYNFTDYLTNISFFNIENGTTRYIEFVGTVQKDKMVTLTFNDSTGLKTYTYGSGSTLRFEVPLYVSWDRLDGDTNFFPHVKYSVLNVKGVSHSVNNHTFFKGEFTKDDRIASREARNWYTENIAPTFANEDWNVRGNSLVNLINANPSVDLKIDIKRLPPIEVETDYSGQTGVQHIKNSDGTITTKGIDAFEYKDKKTNKIIYPSNESTTGWKDKTTGEDITVVEDDVIVDGGKPTDPEAPPGDKEEDPDTDKDKDKIKDKSREWGNLLTTRFPFSLPWDFLYLMKFLYAEPMTPHWEIRGTEKIPFNLNLDLSFLDPYAPWFRTFIFLSFVVSVIFLHGRFMGGSK